MGGRGTRHEVSPEQFDAVASVLGTTAVYHRRFTKVGIRSGRLGVRGGGFVRREQLD